MTGVRYCPGGERLVTVGSEGLVRLWDGANGRLLPVEFEGVPLNRSVQLPRTPLAIHSISQYSALLTERVSTSPSQSMLQCIARSVSRSLAEANRRCSVPSVTAVTSVNAAHSRAFRASSASSAFPSSVLCIADRNDVLLYNLSTGQLLYRLRAHLSDVRCLVLRSNTEELLTAGSDHQLLLWRPEMDECQSREEEDWNRERDTFLATHQNSFALALRDSRSDSANLSSPSFANGASSTRAIQNQNDNYITMQRKGILQNPGTESRQKRTAPSDSSQREPPTARSRRRADPFADTWSSDEDS